MNFRNIKHGMHKTPEYQAWADMKTRCSCATNSRYKDYGGRGITVCASWIESFENFYADMGAKPKNTSLDRINNDGNYEPNNCRWATKEQQFSNRRTSKLTEKKIKAIRALAARGVPRPKLAEKFGVSVPTIAGIIYKKYWKHVT